MNEKLVEKIREIVLDEIEKNRNEKTETILDLKMMYGTKWSEIHRVREISREQRDIDLNKRN